MKDLFKFVISLAVLIGAISMSDKFKFAPVVPVATADPIVVTVPASVKKPLPKKKKYVPRYKGDLYAFMKRLGTAEGLGSYATVSKRGYLGMYQFHPKTLAGIGINVSREEFLATPSLQDSAMVTYMRVNARGLSKIINEFSGTTHNGVYVTKAGILAGAHLVGMGGVLSFFYPEKYSHRTVDGNGVHVTQYMQKFAGYDLRGL